MPPKKQVKMSLNDFLGDNTYGSWADEMDEFPTAPANKGAGGDSGSALSRAPDRGDRGYPPREELPLPTAPPYTAFVGNLPFDVSDSDLGGHFRGIEVKSVKIIRDREDKPKGFGYVEFATVDGLKEGLALSNSQLSGRTIRVSVADPPKEREGRGFGDREERRGFGGGSSAADDEKQWRRDGPLPPREDDRRGGFSRSSSGFGREGGGGAGGGRFSEDSAAGGERGGGFGRSREPPPPSIAEETNDWRSAMKPVTAPPPPSSAGFDKPRFGFGGEMKRRGSGFNTPTGGGGPREFESPKTGPADLESEWTRGSKFRPAEPEQPPSERGERPFGGRKFGDKFGKDEGESEDVSDWRSVPRKIVPPRESGSGPGTPGRGATMERSPSVSGPPTRRKLDLLPRTGDGNTPIGSPKSGEATPASATAVKPNPFGAAKPVDAAAREREIEEKMERAKLTASTPVAQNASLTFSRSREGSRAGSRQGSRQGSPTRSPGKSALGLGGMGSSGGVGAGGPPRILSRGGGPGRGDFGGRGGFGHSRVGSVGMSPKRGPSDGGEWRRGSTTNTNAEKDPAPASTPPASSSTGDRPERRQSTVRGGFSFASAASGRKSDATKPVSAGEEKGE